MSVTELVSVEEYRRTAYSPDCDYVDGVLEDRHVGEKERSKLQRALVVWFSTRAAALGLDVFPQRRVQIAPTRYRVPDVCVTIGEPDEQVFTSPPFLCVEILWPEDQMGRVLSKISDYLEFGVRYVWLIDPRKRSAIVYTASEVYAPEDGVLRTENPAITLPLADLF